MRMKRFWFSRWKKKRMIVIHSTVDYGRFFYWKFKFNCLEIEIYDYQTQMSCDCMFRVIVYPFQMVHNIWIWMPLRCACSVGTTTAFSISNRYVLLILYLPMRHSLSLTFQTFLFKFLQLIRPICSLYSVHYAVFTRTIWG